MTDIAHGGREHAEPMERDDPAGWIDDHVVQGALASEHRLGRVG